MNKRYTAGIDTYDQNSKGGGSLCIRDIKNNKPKLLLTKIKHIKIILFVLWVLRIKTLIERNA